MTSNDIRNELEVLPARRPMQSEAIGQLMLQADAMAAAKQLADALAGTDMVPKDYKNKPGNAAAAILYGAELGLNPIQSLQQIFVVHGSPAIYARTAVALLKKHGLMVETVSSSNDAVTVRASDPHTGQSEQATWDIARADLAGYTSNAKYATNPQEMLYAKAAMEVCRKLAPDILLGIPYAREELELQAPPQRVRSERAGQGIAALRQRAAASQAATAEPGEAETGDTRPASPAAAKPMSEASRRKWISRMFQLLGEANCTERDAQLTVLITLAEIPALAHRDALSDEQLKKVVTQLNKWEKAGELVDKVADILDQAAIDEAQAAEQGESQQELEG